MSLILKVISISKVVRICSAVVLVLWALIFGLRLAWGQSITFSKSVNPNNNTWPATLTDFNGDGILDLGSAGGTKAIIQLGTAGGSFDYGTVIQAIPDNGLNSLNAFVTGDFNGDGKIDFAILANINTTNAEAVVFLGDGTGQFDTGSTVTTSLGQGSPMVAVAGDFNGDGKIDILYYDNSSFKAVLLPGDGHGGFGTPVPVTTALGFTATKAVQADFNHDGKPDVAIAGNFGLGANLYVLINSGTGFTSATNVQLSGSELSGDIIVTDVDKDGKIDLVATVGNPFSGAGPTFERLIILKGNGSGGFTLRFSRVLSGLAIPATLAAGDYNGDGRIDLAIAASATDLQILLDDGSLHFLSSVTVQPGNGDQLQYLLAGDFNHDGKLDLVGPGAFGLYVYLNTSAGGNSGGDTLTRVVPIVLSSAGLNNSFFTSELTLTNRGSGNATITYDYTAAFGGGTGTASDTLDATTQRIYPDAISYLRSIGVPLPDSGGRGGTLRITFSGLSSPGDGAATVRTTTAVANGRAGLAYNGITNADLLNGTAYLCGLRQNSTDRSNAAFINAGSDSDGSIRLRLTVISGEVTALESNQQAALSGQTEIDLQPGGFLQISGILSSYGITNGYIKVERISGTAPFYAYAVVNDQANSDGSFVPPILEGSLAGVTGLTLPVIVETSSFDSELVLTNFSTTAKTLQLSLVAEGIQTSNSTAQISLTLQSGEQQILSHIVQKWRSQGIAGIGPAGSLAGALFVVAQGTDLSGIFVGARTSMPGGGGRYGLFYTAVPRGKAAQSGAWLYGLQQNPENRTNLAVICTGETDGNPDVFRIDLYDGDTGALLGSVNDFSVNARQWKQIDTILSQYASGVNQAYAHIVRVSGSNPFISYVVVNDGGQPGQRSGDGAFVPMDAE